MLLKRISIALVLVVSLLTRPIAQVNVQTGSAVFSIPMFDWHDDKSRLSSTIALSYNSGNGLKVNDLPSNVGQNWNLIAGGVITRMQVGEPDDQMKNEGNFRDDDVTKYPAGYLYTTLDPARGCPTALTRYPTFGGQNQLYAQHNLTGEDKQQDYFTFQFNGKSGMFVLDQSSGDNGVLLGDSKLKVTFQRDETGMKSLGIRTTITSFTITDVDGLIYKFTLHGLTKLLKESFSNRDGSQVATQPSISSGGVYCQAGFDVGPSAGPTWTNQYMANPYIISNWYLSEVDDPFTGRQITFTYNPPLHLSVPAGQDISYNQSNNGSDNYVVISYKKSVTTTLELSSINYQDGHVVKINYAPTQRADYPGESAIASVDILYQNRYVSKYVLTTTYFILNRYGNPTTSYQKSVSRLCLRAVQKIGPDLKDDSPPYYFDYYTGSNSSDDFVPPPFFYGKDIWGFYNGNNSVPFSSSTPMSLNETIPYTLGFDALKGLCFQHTGVTGTYYNAKPGYAQNGLLKQVIYPTGGSLTYTYSQNTGSFVGSGTAQTVGGVHVATNSSADGGYSNGCANPVVHQYNYVVNGAGSASSLWGLETPVNSITSNNSWQEEHQTVGFFGCKWHYIYPGILSQYQATNIEGWQKFVAAISPVLNVLSVITTIDDIVNVLSAVGVGTVAAVVIDIISAILGFVFSCPQKTKTMLSTVFYNFDLNQISPLPAQFKRVEITESPGSIGKTVQEFTHGDASDANLDPHHYYALWDPPGPPKAFSAKQRFAPWAYGLPWRTTVYDVNGNLIKQTENLYDFSFAKEGIFDPLTACCADTYTTPASCKCLVINSSSQRADGWTNPSSYDGTSPFVTGVTTDMIADIYHMYTGRAQVTTTFERTYRTTDATQFVQSETDYFYNTGDICIADNFCQPVYWNFDLKEVEIKQSNGDINYKFLFYPGDYMTGVLATLAQNNVLSQVVSTYSYVAKAGSGGSPSYLDEKVTEFTQLAGGDIRPGRILEQRFAKPQSSFANYTGPTTSNYANYKITESFTYDGNGNLVGIQDEGNRILTNIYDYNDKLIVASVINADPLIDKPAYTSFETNDMSRSGWTISNGFQSVNTSAPSPTGTDNLTLLASSGNRLTSNSLNTSKPYILSFWATNGNVSVSPGTLVKTGPTYNGYTYYEYNVAQGTSSVVLSNSSGVGVNIDEVRLYPAMARMRTTTYDAIIGKTSECDENNRITYYSYDNLGRLQFIKDESGNVVKMYEYNNVSAAKQTGCPVTYANKPITEYFTKSCTAGYQGSAVPVTVAAGTYSSTQSQWGADIQAEIYLLFNGPNIANTSPSGTCSFIYHNAALPTTLSTQSCDPGYKGGPVTYTVPAGRYSSIISQPDADQQAQDDATANAQAYANTPASWNCSIDNSPDWEWDDSSPTACRTINAVSHTFVLATDMNVGSPTYNQNMWVDQGTNSSSGCSLLSANLSLANFSSDGKHADVVVTLYMDGTNTVPVSVTNMTINMQTLASCTTGGNIGSINSYSATGSAVKLIVQAPVTAASYSNGQQSGTNCTISYSLKPGNYNIR